MTYGIFELINTKNTNHKKVNSYKLTMVPPLILYHEDGISYNDIIQIEKNNWASQANVLCYRTFLLYKTDMRKTWVAINDTLQSICRSKRQLEFIFRNLTIRDEDEIANSLMIWFINISRTLSQEIHSAHSFDDYLNDNAPVVHTIVPYMCSILTKQSGCRKKQKLRFLLILIEQVMTNLLKKISVLAQIFTKLWPIYELHNLIIIINIII